AQPAVAVELRHLQRDGAGGAAVGVLEVDQHLGVVVFAALVETPTRAPGTIAAGAEQLLEEIAEGAGVAVRETAAAEFEARIPVRRRLEVLAGLPVGAQLVIGGAFFRVLQYLVG